MSHDRPPLLLCQGFVGSLFDLAADGIGPLRYRAARYWHGIDDALRDAGYRVLTPRVHPTGGIATRARQIKAAALRWRGELRREDGSIPKLVVVAHSMGGLDARYLVSKLGLAEEVSTVLTVSTPHGGTAFADFCLTHLETQAGVYAQLARFGLDVAAGRELTTGFCQRFGTETPDVPGVRYCCVTAAVPPTLMSPLLRVSGRIIDAVQGGNDGLVAASSAEHGEVVARWEVDHFQQIHKIPVLLGPRVDMARQWIKAIEAACAGVA